MDKRKLGYSKSHKHTVSAYSTYPQSKDKVSIGPVMSVMQHYPLGFVSIM